MGILFAIISVVIVIIVIAYAWPVLWPIATTAGDNISAMTGTDAGTTTVQSFWDVVLLLVGLGVAVGLVVFALKKFGVLGGGTLSAAPFIPFFFIPITYLNIILVCVGMFVTMLLAHHLRKLRIKSQV